MSSVNAMIFADRPIPMFDKSEHPYYALYICYTIFENGSLEQSEQFLYMHRKGCHTSDMMWTTNLDKDMDLPNVINVNVSTDWCLMFLHQ